MPVDWIHINAILLNPLAFFELRIGGLLGWYVRELCKKCRSEHRHHNFKVGVELGSLSPKHIL